MVKGIGAVRLRGLLSFFGDLETAWQAPVDGLVAAGLPPKSVEHLLVLRKTISLDDIIANMVRAGIRVLTWDDDDYPRLLKEIDQPPPVIYLRGDYQAEDDWAVAIVGTRDITSYGRQVAEELGTFLGSNGITVVSGLARGVDGIAHNAALQAGGRTLAILGCGVDIIYPPEHTRLAEKIIQHGALMSDYAPGTAPERANFPPRNRIISGLARATIVVEADEKSGALITSTFAAEQGREVFAVPGNIYSPRSRGTNRLVQQGAHILLRPEDILDELNLERMVEHKAARKVIPTDAVEAKILQYLSQEPQPVDELCVQSGLPIEKVSATLAMMELKGMVRQVGGMNYVIMREHGVEYHLE